MVIAFSGLAVYVLLIVWFIYQLAMVGVDWYDVTYRRSNPAVPPNVEDLRALSLVPAWQYEADARLYRIAGVAEDKLVLFTHDNRFVGIDIASGQKSWEYQSLGDITNLVTRDEIALKDDLLVFSSFASNYKYHRLTVLDATSGRELWQQQGRNGFVAATFAVGNEYVYWAIRPHYLAFDRHTGELVWQSELQTGSGGYAGLLYNGQELVVIRPNMHVLDAKTGETKRELQVNINSTPSRIHDQVIYVEDNVDDIIRALDIQQDIILWEQQQLNIFSDVRWTPLLRGDRLYVRLNGSLGVLDASTGEVIWGKASLEKGQPVLYSNPAFVGESAYTIFSDGNLRLLRVADGAEIGSADFKIVTRDAALYATEEMLFVCTGGPTLYAYTFASGE